MAQRLPSGARRGVPRRVGRVAVVVAVLAATTGLASPRPGLADGADLPPPSRRTVRPGATDATTLPVLPSPPPEAMPASPAPPPSPQPVPRPTPPPVLTLPRVPVAVADPAPPAPPRAPSGWVEVAPARASGRAWRIALHGLAAFPPDPDGPFGEAVQGDLEAWRFDALRFGWAGGARLRVERRFEGGFVAAASARWVGAPEEASDQTGVFGYRGSPAGPVLASEPNAATLRRRFEMTDVAVGVRRDLGAADAGGADAPWHVGVGVRWIRVADEASAVDWERAIAPATIPPQVEAEATTSAWLVAVGAGLRVPLGPLRVEVRVGALAGFASREAVVSDRNLFGLGAHRVSDADEGFVFGGEAALLVSYRLSETFSLEAGVECLWLDGVADADQAIDLRHAARGAAWARVGTDDLLLPTAFFGVGVDL